MSELSQLTEATKTLLDLWQSKKWPIVIDDACKEIGTPCQDNDFCGDCEDCPIKKECELIFNLEEAFFRSRLLER